MRTGWTSGSDAQLGGRALRREAVPSSAADRPAARRRRLRLRSASGCTRRPAAGGHEQRPATRAGPRLRRSRPPAIRWRALVGNWASRRRGGGGRLPIRRHHPAVAAASRRAAGRLGGHHHRRRPTGRRAWADPPRLPGDGSCCGPSPRPTRPRIVEACCDPRTQHWLASLPAPVRAEHALAYLEARPRGRPRRAAAGPGASPTPATVAASARSAWRASAATPGGSEIGYWAHPRGARSRPGHRGGAGGHRARPGPGPGRLGRHPHAPRRTGPPGTWPRAAGYRGGGRLPRRGAVWRRRLSDLVSTPGRLAVPLWQLVRVTLRVSVIGTNYLGATHAAGMAEFGHRVVGSTSTPDRVATLAAGPSHIFEVGLEPLLARHTRLRPAAVHHRLRRDRGLGRRALPGLGTPARPDGAADLSSWTPPSTPWRRC